MKNQFELLNSSDSWRSQLSTIVHIDLDAFYAQVQTVNLGLSPEKPLACRQWHSVIAVNYPARKFGVKRSMSVKECRELCPEIELPHVATFKKGSTSWSLEQTPRDDTHKVSLDLFRSESRKIFKIFAQNFGLVEKAGIDEGFMDLGPQVYARALTKYPQLSDYSEDLSPPEGSACWHDALLELAGEMVHDTRMEIHEKLHYTCSAGIAGNKHLAKLGSGFNKPFNQTVVLSGHKQAFLSKHKFSDIWGWGGKRGKEVLDQLQVGDNPVEISKLGVEGIFAKTNDMERAKLVYETAMGEHKSALKQRTMVKSMLSVKNFSNKPLNTMKDLQDWLIVYCADLSGRMEDLSLDDPEGHVYRPQTIAVRYTGGVVKTQISKQMPCSLPYHKSPIEALSGAVLKLLPSDEKKLLPCLHFGVELSNLNAAKPTQLFTAKVDRATQNAEDDLFVSDQSHYCKKCNEYIPIDQEAEHGDWHLAKSLQNQINSAPATPKKTSRAPGPKPAGVRKPSSAGQTSLFNYFKKV